MKLTDFLPKGFVDVLKVPIFGIAISTYSPTVNLLINPYSFKGFLLSFVVGWAGFIFLTAFVELWAWIDEIVFPKIFGENDSGSAMSIVGLGLLTWAVAITLAYCPTKENLQLFSLFHDSNVIRLIALYIVSVSTLQLRMSMNKSKEKRAKQRYENTLSVKA